MAKKKVQEEETPERTTSITVGTLIGYIERHGRVRNPDTVESVLDVFLSLGNAYIFTLDKDHKWGYDRLDFHLGDAVRVLQVFEDDGNGTMALKSTKMEPVTDA